MIQGCSEETWRLADERVSAKRGTRVRARLQRLGRAFMASLKGDRKGRVEDAGKNVEGAAKDAAKATEGAHEGG